MKTKYLLCPMCDSKMTLTSSSFGYTHDEYPILYYRYVCTCGFECESDNKYKSNDNKHTVHN